MPYQISREGQLYGPYTLEDLRRYIESGNILPTDFAKSEEMTDWIPVSQILSSASPSASTPISTPIVAAQAYATTPSYFPVAATGYPDPPNLHWALVLLFGFFTCGLFFVVWDLVQALWAKKIEPQTKAVLYFSIYAIFWILYFLSSMGSALPAASRGETPRIAPLAALCWLVMVVFVIVYRFAMKATLERHFNGPEPIGLRLNGVMTFFFGCLYFQYHLTRINQIKQASRYRGY